MVYILTCAPNLITSQNYTSVEIVVEKDTFGDIIRITKSWNFNTFSNTFPPSLSTHVWTLCPVKSQVKFLLFNKVTKWWQIKFKVPQMNLVALFHFFFFFFSPLLGHFWRGAPLCHLVCGAPLSFRKSHSITRWSCRPFINYSAVGSEVVAFLKKKPSWLGSSSGFYSTSGAASQGSFFHFIFSILVQMYFIIGVKILTLDSLKLNKELNNSNRNYFCVNLKNAPDKWTMSGIIASVTLRYIQLLDPDTVLRN